MHKTSSVYVLPLLSAIAPFILWPVEIVFPYPHIVEELAKLLLILLLLRGYTFQVHGSDTFRLQLKLVVLAGLLFALSETVLYLFNIYLVGNVAQLLLRLGLTTSLHVLTFLVIFVSLKKNLMVGIMGVLAAMLIHFAFNNFVSVAF